MGEVSSYGIIAGKTVQENSVISKSVFLIKTDFGQSGQAFCTASLIAKDILLTAAHCVLVEKGEVSQKGKTFFSANPACSKKENQLRSAGFKKVIAHADYVNGKESTDNDMALILLDAEAPTESIVLDVAKEFNAEDAGLKLFAIGYGNRKGYSRFDENPVRLRMTKFEQSQLVKSSTRNGFDNIITVEQKKSGVCAGDSGGPLLLLQNGKPQVLGIASTVSPSDDGTEACSGYANYKSTLHIHEWIEKTKQELKK